MRQPAFKIGNKIGPFTILEKLSERDYQGSIVWRCKCKCGDEISLSSMGLKVHSTKECHLEIIKRTAISQDPAIGRRYSKYKGHAKTKNRSFTLSIQEFTNLVNSECAYCGVSGPNGIDRIDSGQGYELDNCYSCCTPCNRAKSDMSVENFRKYLIRLANFVLRQS